MPVRVRRPSLPSSVLPKLSRSLTNSDLSSDKLLSLIEHLRLLYAPADDRAHPTEQEAQEAPFSHEVEEDDTVDPLWAQDAFERTWTVNWLNMVVRRGDEWIQEAQEEGNDAEKQRRVQIVDEAAGLVSLLTATSGA